MNFILIIPRALWKTLFLLNFILGLVILYPLFYIFLSRKDWFPYAFKLKRFWAYWIYTVPGLFAKTTWKIPTAKLPQPCVYAANHVSYLDIISSYIVVPNYFVFMGKQELDKAPLFRIFFKKMNILVDRKSNVGSHKAFLRAGRDIEEGSSVFLFPEGTISSNGDLRGFKNGAFKLAIDKQVPVVPVTFLNNWKLLQNGGFFKTFGKPGISRIVVHEPILTTGMTENDLLSLKAKVHEVISSELKKYNKNN